MIELLSILDLILAEINGKSLLGMTVEILCDGVSDLQSQGIRLGISHSTMIQDNESHSQCPPLAPMVSGNMEIRKYCLLRRLHYGDVRPR